MFSRLTSLLLVAQIALVSVVQAAQTVLEQRSPSPCVCAIGPDRSAAIDIERKEFFESKVGAILATTETERSNRETAILTSLSADGNINFSVGGNTYLTLYAKPGEASASVADLYPEELEALAGLVLLDQELLDEYFYDKTKALSPAFTMVLTIALTSGFGNLIGASMKGSALATNAGQLTHLGKAVASMAASTTVGIANGTVSGELDLGQILRNAAISAGTSYLQNAVNLKAAGDTTGAANAQAAGMAANEAANALGNRTFNLLGDSAWGAGLTDPLLGFGKNLTVANILEGAFDASIGATVQTAAYGGDFGDAFKGSFINSVVALGLADAQTGIGDVFSREGSGGEGSLGHVLLHGLAGCVAAEAQGADCAAGAAGGIAGAIYSGMQKSPEIDDYGNDLDAYRAAYDNWRSDVMDRAQLVSLAAGYIFSGGKAENVSVGASVGTSAVANNYLTHDQLLVALEADEQLAKCKINPFCSSQERTRLENIVQSYRALSAVNTANLIEACSAGASTCTQMLADALAFTEATRHGLALMAGGYAPGPENFYVRADGQLGYGGMVDIDEVAVRYFTRAENGEMTYAEAAQAIESSVLNHESNMTILVGGVQIVGGVAALGACPSTGGLSCLLLTGAAVTTPNVVLGANEASEGVAQWLSGQNERTAIEDALIRAGHSPEDAARYLGNAQLLVGVLDIGVGGLLAIKGPLGTARVGGSANGGLDNLISRGVWRSADEANATFPLDYSPPYTPGTKVAEFIADGNQSFVRVFSGDRQQRSWMMQADEISGLSAEQIADKFALPEVPTHITSVRPPAGTRIRTGQVNPNFGRPGGGTQFELLDRITDGWGDVSPIP